MLELDLTLSKFLGRHALALKRPDLTVLSELLELGDNELWELVSGRAACKDARQTEMLRRLQED
jgi:succinate dehydrogenase flavin-adding protein (antitoxin of CptAB toxin-antitoxin module)